MPKFIDLTGSRFGRLVVIEKIETGKPRSWWRVRCDCGNDDIAASVWLRSGDKQSCGCLHSEVVSKLMTTHGHSHRGKWRNPTREYSTWRAMKSRCYWPKNIKYRRYGGRGIKVCDRWLNSFENFLSDMGPRPAKKEIERIDNDGNYEPRNCRWATRSEQMRNACTNRNYEHNGKRQCLTAWAEELGIGWHTLYYRIERYGWDVDRAFTTPPPG